MINHGNSGHGGTNETDTLTALVRAEAKKSGVGVSHLEGPLDLAKRVLAKRGKSFLHTDSLEALVTKLVSA